MIVRMRAKNDSQDESQNKSQDDSQDEIQKNPRYRAALRYDPKKKVAVHSLGPMDVDCPHCGALYFRGEKVGSLCCQNGKLKLPDLSHNPELEQLLKGRSPEALHFRRNMMNYHILMSAFNYDPAEDFGDQEEDWE